MVGDGVLHWLVWGRWVEYAWELHEEGIEVVRGKWDEWAGRGFLG